jgi:hypothetical protein
MSRRVYLPGVGLAPVALAFALTGALLWEPGATEANLGRVRVGMTLAEAEVILGPSQFFWSSFPAVRRSFLARLRSWLGR